MQFPPPNACENHRGHSPPRAITQEASREASANVFRKEPGCVPAPAPAPTAFPPPTAFPIQAAELPPPPPPPPPAPRPAPPHSAARPPAAYVDPAQTAPNKQNGRWSKQEHQQFLDLMEVHGRSWTKIARCMDTRTEPQVRSHAQKHFIRLEKEAKRKGEAAPAPSRAPSTRPKRSPPTKRQKVVEPPAPVVVTPAAPAAPPVVYYDFAGQQFFVPYESMEHTPPPPINGALNADQALKHLTVDAHAAADPHPYPWAGVARLDSMDSIHSTELYPLPAASSWFPTAAPAERPPLVHTHSAEVGAAELIGLLHSDDAQAQAVN